MRSSDVQINFYRSIDDTILARDTDVEDASRVSIGLFPSFVVTKWANRRKPRETNRKEGKT